MTKKTPSSNIEWKEWGGWDPLWGVASWNGKKKDGANPWTDSEFYKLGESDWEDFSAHWGRFGVNKSSILEIGCGAGRITRQLAKYFNVVHAVDVSEGMIEYARKHADTPSVIFHLSDGAGIPMPDNSFTAVFSCHVFQHLDSIGHVTEYFHEVYRVLQPGGSIMIHIPIYVWPWGIGKVIPLLYRLRKTVDLLMACTKRSLMRRLKLHPIMRMTSFSEEYVFNILGELGYTDIAFSIFRTKSNGGLHHFVFAKKICNPLHNR